MGGGGGSADGGWNDSKVKLKRGKRSVRTGQNLV